MFFLNRSTRSALYYKEEELTYNQFIDRVAWLAGQYEAAAGARIAILAENTPAWIIAFYSIWFKHAILVPIDAQATPEEIAYVLKDATPSLLFCSARTRANAETALQLAASTIPLKVLDELDFSQASCDGPDFPDSGLQETAVIIYTSGTTGSPKGVMLSYENLYANLKAVSEEVRIYIPDDRLLVLLPLHHVLPLMGTVIMPLFLGAACVIAPSMSAPDLLETLNRRHVTMMIGVPRLYTLLHDSMMSKVRQHWFTRALFKFVSFCDSLAFSRIVFHSVQKKFGGAFRFMPSGGAALDPEIIHDFRTLGFEILNGYGMTECAPMISFTRPGNPRAGSAGQRLPANEIRIVDGELTVRGKNVMQGYYNRPEETAEVLKDGWLYTGDQGYVDEDDFVFLTGRKKEIIVMPNGKNINPEEVEGKLLLLSSYIAEVAVVPSGDVLQAVILPNAKALQADGVLNIEQTIRDQVISVYNQQASSYKRIGKCLFINESLPRTRMGKVKRHELPALIAQCASGTAKETRPEPDTEEYRSIRKFLADFTGQPVRPDDHFELDLNLDSLGKVAFQTFLEGTFGQEVSDRTLAEHPTPEKLAEFLHAQNLSPLTGKVFEWGELLKKKVHLSLPKTWFAMSWLNLCSRALLHCSFRLHGDGLEHIPEGPCIFAPNHQSYLDGLFVTAYLKGKNLRDTFFYAKAEHVRHWWTRFLANRNNVIVMDVNNDLKLSIQKLASVLRQGKKIVVFPEGTRTLDGSLGDFKQMFAILCRELAVPIVPVAIDGAFDALPRTRFFPRFFQKVNVSFLPPVCATSEDDYNSIIQKVVSEIQPCLGKA